MPTSFKTAGRVVGEVASGGAKSPARASDAVAARINRRWRAFALIA
jgi:hypothetical protein